MPDPIPTFSFVITQIREQYPSLAYIHVIRSRDPGDGDSLEFARQLWSETDGRVFISADGFDPVSAAKSVESFGGAVAFGKWYLSNPDLPVRMAREKFLAC